MSDLGPNGCVCGNNGDCNCPFVESSASDVTRILPREHPILFSSSMVRAILAGTKTQTRRLITPQPVHAQHHTWRGEVLYDAEHRIWWWKRHSFQNLIDFEDGRRELAKLAPYGKPGDRLWVRETHCFRDREFHPEGGYWYAATDDVDNPTWRPSIHMPREASRITLAITEVRVQRLQDIDGGDCVAEGILLASHRCDCEACRMTSILCPATQTSLGLAYADLWDQINGNRAPWSSNPWVWCVSFKRVEKLG